MQLLKSPGACVTAICTIENVELVKGLEAGKGTDYTAGDFTSPVSGRIGLAPMGCVAVDPMGCVAVDADRRLGLARLMREGILG